MRKRKRWPAGRLDLLVLHEDELAVLARYGDTEARSLVWERSIDLTARVVSIFIARYPWIDRGDLNQSVLVEFPKFLRRYKPHLSRGWNKYLYHCIYRAVQDALRAEDPLGINYPHKKHYPFWRRFSEVFDGPDALDEITSGVERLNRGEVANLSPDPPSYSTPHRRKRVRSDSLYHGRKPKHDGG